MKRKVDKTFDAAKKRVGETWRAYARAVKSYNKWVSRMKKITLKGKL